MRKLATAALSFSAAVYAANYVIPFGWLIPIAVIFAVAGATLALLREKWIKPLVTVLLFFSIGTVCYAFHYHATVEKAAQFDGQTHMVSAQVLDFPKVYDDYCRLEVRITSYYLPSFKAVLYDNDKAFIQAKPGDSVVLKAKLSTADTIFGEKYDNYHSKGIYLKLSSRGNESLYRSFDIFSLPKYLSHWLSNKIENTFPEDTQVFMRALMLGDKDDFYLDDALYADINRAGIMHIVAVSGMHISFLVGLFHFFLGGGRRSALLCLAMVWAFALITGSSPSVVRAAFMQSCVLMAPVLKREDDPVTSISTILALILAANPFAAASISLQLSFGAMAGIVLFSGEIYSAAEKALGRLSEYKPVRYVIASISCSLAVMPLTIPLTAIHFGSVPLLSPLTNLLCLPVVSLCFSGGWICCALSAVPVLGDAAAWICSWLARYIFFAADLVSSVPFSVLYMQTKGAWLWIILSGGLFVLFPLLFRRHKLLSFAVPTSVSVLIIAGIMYANAVYYDKTETVNILDVGQGQCISLLTDELTVLIDCGNISNLDDAGTIAAAHLYSRGRDSVDMLILSHLHEDHAGGVPMLLEMVDVKRIVLPYSNDKDDALYQRIIQSAQLHGCEITRVDRNTTIDFADIHLELFKSGGGSNENERCIITKASIDEFDILAMADANKYMEKKLVEREDLSSVDVLVVSHHGSAYSSSYELLRAVGGNIAVISSGYNNYGHPAEETLERLKKCGYNIYRTDEDNTIEIRIG